MMLLESTPVGGGMLPPLACKNTNEANQVAGWSVVQKSYRDAHAAVLIAKTPFLGAAERWAPSTHPASGRSVKAGLRHDPYRTRRALSRQRRPVQPLSVAPVEEHEIV